LEEKQKGASPFVFRFLTGAIALHHSVPAFGGKDEGSGEKRSRNPHEI
jgi:hypothetical protein